jgi:hypothetical protein
VLRTGTSTHIFGEERFPHPLHKGILLQIATELFSARKLSPEGLSLPFSEERSSPFLTNRFDTHI